MIRNVPTLSHNEGSWIIKRIADNVAVLEVFKNTKIAKKLPYLSNAYIPIPTIKTTY